MASLHPIRQSHFARVRRRSRCGATLVEYALMAVFLVSVTIVVWQNLSGGSGRTFARVSDSMLASTDKAERTAAAPAAAVPQTDSVWDDATVQALRRNIQWRNAIIVFVSCFAGLLIYRHRHAFRKRQAASKELQESAQQFEERIFAKRQEVLRVLSSDIEAVIRGEVLVRHIMTRQVAAVTADKSLDETRAAMVENRIRHVVVCTNGGELQGIVSDRDLLTRHGRTVGQIMTTKPVCVSPDTPINQAVSSLLSHRVSCLPVTSEGAICGLITTTDMLMAMQCSFMLMQQLGQEVEGSH